MNKQLHVIFRGTVQGVGFRYNVEKISTRFPVTGYVKNLPDGTVELVAEGSAAALESFLKAIGDSWLAGYIRDKDVEWKNAENLFERFEIAR